MKHSNSEISAAVERAASILGSQKALADLLGVSPQAVWAWIHRGSIPPTYCVAIEKATDGEVSRNVLRPDDFHLIWPEYKASRRSKRDSVAA